MRRSDGTGLGTVPATAALMIVVSFHGVDERRPAMAGPDRMTVEEVVRKVLRDEHADVIRESVTAIAREIMEAEVSELIGAELGERRPDDRATHRNGYRPRRWDTRAGRSSCRSPGCARAAIARASWSRASALSRRWSVWSNRPTCGGVSTRRRSEEHTSELQ